MNANQRNFLERLRLQSMRRSFLRSSSVGIGGLALNSLLQSESRSAERSPAAAGEVIEKWQGVVRPLHFPARCRRVIHLCMAGGASHLETFDYKPKLAELDGPADAQVLH
jgi:hypothetical protein